MESELRQTAAHHGDLPLFTTPPLERTCERNRDTHMLATELQARIENFARLRRAASFYKVTSAKKLSRHPAI